MIPFWTSFVVRTYAWVNLLKNNGPVEQVLNATGLHSGSLNVLYSPTAVTIGILYSYLPLMILPLFVALERIDPGLSHAAADLGASGWRVFRRVTFPLSMPGVIAGCILVGVPATGEYVIPSILGGGKTLMYGNVVADQFFEIGNYPFGAALAMSMMALVTLFLVVARIGPRARGGRHLMRRRLSAVSVFSGLVFVFLYLPIVVVILNSVNSDKFLVSWGGFTTKWYSQALNDSRVRTDFITSAEVALLSSLIAVIIAVCASLWARTAHPWSKRAMDSTTYMRIVLPEVVLATALFIFIRRLHIELGLIAIVIGHVVFNSAYATVVIQARLATLPATYEEAATDLGASPRRVFQRVTLPLLAPAILVAFLLAVSFSFDDVVTSLFLGGTNAETLPVLLLGLIRIEVTPEVNAIAVGVMLITLITFAVAAGVITVRGIAGVRPDSPVKEGE